MSINVKTENKKVETTLHNEWRYELYTAYDKLAGEAGPVFMSVNDMTAVRQFQNIIKELPKDDFKLYKLGRYSPKQIKIEALQEALLIYPLEDKKNG